MIWPTEFLFRCRDGKCLDISLVCDHHVDCLEREDEDCGMSLVDVFTFQK